MGIEDIKRYKCDLCGVNKDLRPNDECNWIEMIHKKLVCLECARKISKSYEKIIEIQKQEDWDEDK